MENGKLKTDDGKRGDLPRKSSAIQFQKPFEKKCPACGAEVGREDAKFCRICGRLFGEDYQPLDTLRASNRLQGQTFLVENAERAEVTNLFPAAENWISETAWACLVYSLVPYLGILFVPLALAVGVFGVAVSFRPTHAKSRKLSLISVALSLVMLAVQLFLWWLLYIIPEIGKQI